MNRTIITVFALAAMASCSESEESSDEGAGHKDDVVSIPLTSNIDEPIAEAQQKIGPISFLMCGLFAGGTALFTRYALCPHGTTEQDRANCNDVGLWGGVGIGILCSLPF